MLCIQCGRENEISDRLCMGCESSWSGETTPDYGACYKAVIGPRQQYYLERFADFDDEGAGMTWHWPAFFCAPFWLLYRKMWVYAGVYCVLPFLASALLDAIHRGAGESMATAIGLLWLALLIVVTPLYANALYHHQCRRRIDSVCKSPSGPRRQWDELVARGGTSRVAVLVALLSVVLFMAGFLASDRSPFHQPSREMLAESAEYGLRAVRPIGTYFVRYQQLPDDLTAVGFDEPLPASVSSIRFDARTGLIRIGMAGNNGVERALLFIASWGKGNRLIWRCVGDNIDVDRLPQSCR